MQRPAHWWVRSFDTDLHFNSGVAETALFITAGITLRCGVTLHSNYHLISMNRTSGLPSLTGMAGFFCLRPRSMKKRTSGMKISKASTHWGGRAEHWRRYSCCISSETPWWLPVRLLQSWLFSRKLLLVASHPAARRSDHGRDLLCLLSHIDPMHQDWSATDAKSAKLAVSAAHGCHWWVISEQKMQFTSCTVWKGAMVDISL